MGYIGDYLYWSIFKAYSERHFVGLGFIILKYVCWYVIVNQLKKYINIVGRMLYLNLIVILLNLFFICMLLSNRQILTDELAMDCLVKDCVASILNHFQPLVCSSCYTNLFNNISNWAFPLER